jgi:histone-lysine N-methyltransferase SETMAR
MDMVLKPKFNRRSGWGKVLVGTHKEGTDESVKIKVLLVVFFDWKGIVYHCTRRSDGKNQLCQEVLARLRDAVRRKSPKFRESQTLLLHHDNAPTYSSLPIHIYQAKHQTSVVPHPPYSPDLAPEKFFLFPKIKTTFKGRHFQTIEGI